MGCGTGLLLDYISNHLGYDVISFGVDFLYKSIQIARKSFPQFHFSCTDAHNFHIPSEFKKDCIILLDPYHYLSKDLEKMLRYYKSIQADVVLYTYGDVLLAKGLSNIMQFEALNTVNANFCILDSMVNTVFVDNTIATNDIETQ